MALQTHTVTVRIRGERPGIGAVVAIVAAARMVRGGWMSPDVVSGRNLQSPGVCHWSFGPVGVKAPHAAACGEYWDDECFEEPWIDHDDSSHLLDDVDCPDCLAIARWAGALKEEA